MNRTDTVEKVLGIYCGLVKWREEELNENDFSTDFSSQCAVAVRERERESVYVRPNPCIFTLCSQRGGWLGVCILKKITKWYCPLLERNGTICTVPISPHKAAQNSKLWHLNICRISITQVYTHKALWRQLKNKFKHCCKSQHVSIGSPTYTSI